MRKLFVTLLLFCMSASVYAVDWAYIGRGEGARHYIDIDSIEDVSIDGETYKSAWIKFVLEEPGDFFGKEFAYSIGLAIFSCQDKKSAFSSNMLYDQKGNLVHRSDKGHSNLNFEYFPDMQPELVCERSKEEIREILKAKQQENTK